MLVIPISVWILSTGNIADYFDPSVPDGQLLYVLSKLVGLITLSLIVIQVSTMSAKHILKRADKLSWRITSHQKMGICILGCATLHASLFFAASSARSEHLAWGLLFLHFNSGFYDAMVSIGLIALCALWLAGVLGWYSLKETKFKIYHRMAVTVSTLAVIVHSYSIGSETHTLPVRLYYGFLLCILLGSLVSIIRGFHGKISHS